MTKAQRRRRAGGLLAIALLCGGLAASEVSDTVREAQSRVGAPVAVVVAARDLEAGERIERSALRVVDVPARYAPRDAATVPSQVVGLRPAGPVAAGSPITAGVVGGAESGPLGLRPGERAVEVAVAGGGALAEVAGPGTRVDVAVSTEPGDGPGETFLALEDVELLSIGPSSEPALDDTATTPTLMATMRVTAKQAVYLTAAQNFARELRLLPRPPGDRRSVGRAQTSIDGR